MVIHCCHCTECQIQSGSCFALNGAIEHYNVTHDNGEPEKVHMPAASGKGQTIARCANCKTAIWSNYTVAGELTRFVRMGTLEKDPRGEDPAKGQLLPDVHIYTKMKAPWVTIPQGSKICDEFYDDPSKIWRPEGLERMQKLMAESGSTA